MTIIQIKNHVYSAFDNSTIDCEIEHPVYGWIPFTASPDDPEALGLEVYAQAVVGDFSPVALYVVPITAAQQAGSVNP